MSDERPAPLPRPSSPGVLPVPTPSAREPLRPMPGRTIALIAAGIFVLSAGLVVALWWAGTAGLSGQALVTARFDALRTGLSIGLGGGGLFALYLAWRRQHATEVGLAQKERDQADVARAYDLQREVAEHTRADAEARRITELYAKSAEQLGSDKAPVRLAGLYALERLAQDNPHQRQTVVNLLCAYLRMPYTPPGPKPDDSADGDAHVAERERAEELQVRQTARRILATHLHPGDNIDRPVETFWPDLDLDLTNAALVNFDLTDCHVRNTTFSGASFVENATFSGVNFAGIARFDRASFTGSARFRGASFADTAQFEQTSFAADTWFGEANFAQTAWFIGTKFSGDTLFSGATFSGTTRFTAARFTNSTLFGGTTFAGTTLFEHTIFTRDVWFARTRFTMTAVFTGASFAEDMWLDEVLIASPSPDSSWPAGWRVTDEPTAVDGQDDTWYRLERISAGPVTSPSPQSP
ncbi:pentapeptide repeat-containing protein [Saccharothrix lopnurensis]|uniref:Pentapeptide repeat-containing protein n=1 Tax=Saccharothrix lopnurensis TaxID=1670621 RepID=A0ABW1PG31_9PSEU